MILMSQVLSDNLIKNLDEGVMKSWRNRCFHRYWAFSGVWCWHCLSLTLVVRFTIWCDVCSKSLCVAGDAEEGVCQFADQVLKYFLWIRNYRDYFGLVWIYGILACSRSGIFGCDGRSCFTGKFVELCGWSFDSRFASFPRGRLYH